MMENRGITCNPNGYFSLAGARFVPVGVNYWPGSCGVEMWQRWPIEEIRHDLDVVRSLGLNTLRFFLRWQDFEPEPGRYDPVMFERLRLFLEDCRERGLIAQPSLFVGFMSGGIFWPRWHEKRNVFSDPFLLDRAAAFARRASEVIAPFHGSLLGTDQGNELCCLPDSRSAPPGAVVTWCRTISEAVRSAYPHGLIVSGNEQNQIVNDTGWRLGNQPGTDYYSMHGYPVPAWHPIGFDGMTDPLAQSLLPFYVRVARAFGPVLVQEFGTIVTFGARQQDTYLRAVLPACWEAGANGFLWWCLRDIHAPVYPYTKNSFEGTLGLVDAEDRVKPGLEFFLEFARSLPERPAPASAAGAVGLYLPRHYYNRDDPDNPDNDPKRLSRSLLIANFLLRELGHEVCIVRGDLPLDTGVRTILIAGAALDLHEVEALEAWVTAGGRLIWHGPDPMNWGHACVRLLGAKPVDYRASRAVGVHAFGEDWSLADHPRHTRLEVVPGTATVLARADDDLPLLLTHRFGAGRVVYALPLLEETIARRAEDRAERGRWKRWYEAVLTDSGSHPR